MAVPLAAALASSLAGWGVLLVLVVGVVVIVVVVVRVVAVVVDVRTTSFFARPALA